MKSIKDFSKNVFDYYGNRKRTGRIDFFVDVDNGDFYPVPRDFEHKDFVKKLGGKNLVPSQLRLREECKNYHLLEVIIGASSYEATTDTRHKAKYLVAAMNYTWDFIGRSPIINVWDLKRNKIIHTFEKD